MFPVRSEKWAPAILGSADVARHDAYEGDDLLSRITRQRREGLVHLLEPLLVSPLEVGPHEVREVHVRGRPEARAQQQSSQGERDQAGASPHEVTVSRGRVRHRSCIQSHCSGARRMAASIARLNMVV